MSNFFVSLYLFSDRKCNAENTKNNEERKSKKASLKTDQLLRFIPGMGH